MPERAQAAGGAPPVGPATRGRATPLAGLRAPGREHLSGPGCSDGGSCTLQTMRRTSRLALPVVLAGRALRRDVVGRRCLRRRGEAATYADTYWQSYNPAWPSFAKKGGDCTNFVSQALYAGGIAMRPSPPIPVTRPGTCCRARVVGGRTPCPGSTSRATGLPAVPSGCDTGGVVLRRRSRPGRSQQRRPGRCRPLRLGRRRRLRPRVHRGRQRRGRTPTGPRTGISSTRTRTTATTRTGPSPSTTRAGRRRRSSSSTSRTRRADASQARA